MRGLIYIWVVILLVLLYILFLRGSDTIQNHVIVQVIIPVIPTPIPTLMFDPLIALRQSMSIDFGRSIPDVQIIATDTKRAHGNTDGKTINIMPGLDPEQYIRVLSHEYCHIAFMQIGCKNSRLQEAFCDAYAIETAFKAYKVAFNLQDNYYSCISRHSNACIFDIAKGITCDESVLKSLLQQKCNINTEELNLCLKK